MSRLKIVNAQIVTPKGILPNKTVLIEQGKIVAVTDTDIPFEYSKSIDAQGLYLSPGFIDLHIHGGGGADFMDANEEAFLRVAETHAQFGTTSFVPTTLTTERESLVSVIESFRSANRINKKGANFLGLHLEGPYFSPNQNGAQDSRYIRNPDPEEYQELVRSTPEIIRWSAAPELNGAMEFGKFLKDHNILASIGHSDATSDEVAQAIENGYRHITHLYSAMSGVTRRNGFRFAGVIESAYLFDELTVEIIADGAHLPADLLKLIVKIKGPSNIALITDAMRAAGTMDRESILGSAKNGMRVIIEDGVAKLPDRSAFAGSIATSDRLVYNMIKLAEVSLCDAVTMMTLTPANIAGVQKSKGTIAVGKDADLILFDEDIQVMASIINGQIIKNKLKIN